MKITNLEELKEATKKVNHKALEKKWIALNWMQKINQYEPKYGATYVCECCPYISNYEVECPHCDQMMIEFIEL